MNSKVILQNAGLRPTKQRIIVADILFMGDNMHFSAEYLQNEIIKSGKYMSLATVYNNLNKFKKVNLIKQLEIAGETSIFDTNVNEHHHFFREDTGELIDIDPSDVSFKNLPDTPLGFQTTGLDVTIKIKKV